MIDSKNREIKTGDIVQITGGYFKTSNGVFYVSNLDTEKSLWLHRIKKNGEICVNSASSVQNWPLTSYCSDRRKNAEAKKHNAENAKIEIVGGVNSFYVAEYFRQKAEQAQESADLQRERFGDEERAGRLENDAAAYRAVSERLSASAEQPKQKEPEHGIKFYWNGIKVDGGRLIPCYFWAQENAVIISAKDYNHLPREYFAVKNDTDIYTDYFDSDSTTLTPEHPLYRFARYVAYKGIANGHSYRKFTPEQEKEWSRMKDPGQPTAADLQAVADMNTAAESARLAKEHAEQMEERENMLRQRSEGRHYIEDVAEQHPLNDGEPSVEITWSEHPAFYSWTESRDQTRTEIKIHADGTREEKTVVETPRRRLILSVAAAEIVLKHFDEQQPEHSGYYKTGFVIRWNDPNTGEENEYEGRYDLGDHDGGLIEHIRAFAEYGKDEQISQLADYFEQYKDGGRIVKVELAPGVTDLAAYRRKLAQEQEEKQKQEASETWRDIMDTVAMMTNDQLESAVFCVDPNDKEKADVARFFLQELSRRDESLALDVFRRWRREA